MPAPDPERDPRENCGRASVGDGLESGVAVLSAVPAEGLPVRLVREPGLRSLSRLFAPDTKGRPRLTAEGRPPRAPPPVGFVPRVMGLPPVVAAREFLTAPLADSDGTASRKRREEVRNVARSTGEEPSRKGGAATLRVPRAGSNCSRRLYWLGVEGV